MGRPHKPLERRLNALEATLARVPAPHTPQREAEKQRRWEQVLQAYATACCDEVGRWCII